MSVGPWQIAIIALVVLLLFGATRLGDIGKGLGEGIRNFKKGISDDPDDEGDADKVAKDSGKQLEKGTAASQEPAESDTKKEG